MNGPVIFQNQIVHPFEFPSWAWLKYQITTVNISSVIVLIALAVVSSRLADLNLDAQKSAIELDHEIGNASLIMSQINVGMNMSITQINNINSQMMKLLSLSSLFNKSLSYIDISIQGTYNSQVETKILSIPVSTQNFTILQVNLYLINPIAGVLDEVSTSIKDGDNLLGSHYQTLYNAQTGTSTLQFSGYSQNEEIGVYIWSWHGNARVDCNQPDRTICHYWLTTF